MRDFQNQKSKWRQVLESKPSLVLLFVLLVFLAWNVVVLYGKMRKTAADKSLADAQVQELEARKKELSADISRLETESGIEASIREKFGLAKEGEGVIVIEDQQNSASVTAVKSSGGFWDFLKNWFK